MAKNQQQVEEFAELCTKEDGKLQAPTLWNINTRGKYLLWTIYVGLTEAECDDEDERIYFPIKKDNIYQGHMPDDMVGTFWTISGQEGGKMTKSAATFVFDGKNIGKENATTPFTQAILEARSLYMKKINKGYVVDKSKIKKPGAIYTFEDLFADESRGATPWRVFAMALHNYDKFKRHIIYPATVQAKLDGTLFMVVHHPLLPEVNGMRIDGYSRRRETYENQGYILEELWPIVQNYPGLQFVGELWKKGHGLQEVSGNVRRKVGSKAKGEEILLEYHIFDCFYIDGGKTGFMERQAILDEVMNAGPSGGWKYVRRIPTIRVENEEEMKTHYQSYLDEGLEGAVIRNLDAPYEFGLNKEMRSYKSLKLKPREDSEWPVVGWGQGDRGKEVGAIIWTCAENDEGVVKRAGELLPLGERLTFNVTPNMTYDNRYLIYEKLSEDPTAFEQRIYGQGYTISYTRLSANLLPQEPKGLHFRDEKIDKWLMK